jgi:hypothetical protein
VRVLSRDAKDDARRRFALECAIVVAHDLGEVHGGRVYGFSAACQLGLANSDGEFALARVIEICRLRPAAKPFANALPAKKVSDLPAGFRVLI